jgi:hypothetical protein
MRNSIRRARWARFAAAAWALSIGIWPHAVQAISADDPSTSYDAAPQRLVWPGVAVIIVIAIFISAALAGPLIRANTDESSEPSSSPDNSD